MMFLCFRRLFLWTLFVISVIGIAAVLWLWHTAGKLTDEIRTPVPDYYQTWLQQPEKHGMQVQIIPCDNRQSYCLIALPDAKAALGNRGRVMRRQLQFMQVTLPRQGMAKGIMVLLHGRGSRKEFMLPIAERFVAAGFICVIPDLPAHGEHLLRRQYFAGTNDEAAFAERVLDDARQHLKQPELPAALWAMSLGGAFANRSVANNEKVWRSLVIVSSFDELNKVLRDKLDFLPDFLADNIHLLFLQILKWRQGFDVGKASPKQWAADITLPVLVVHGDQDTVIRQPHGKALFDAYKSNDKTWINVSGGNHHNVLITPMPLYATMGAWLLQHLSD